MAAFDEAKVTRFLKGIADRENLWKDLLGRPDTLNSLTDLVLSISFTLPKKHQELRKYVEQNDTDVAEQLKGMLEDRAAAATATVQDATTAEEEAALAEVTFGDVAQGLVQCRRVLLLPSFDAIYQHLDALATTLRREGVPAAKLPELKGLISTVATMCDIERLHTPIKRLMSIVLANAETKADNVAFLITVCTPAILREVLLEALQGKTAPAPILLKLADAGLSGPMSPPLPRTYSCLLLVLLLLASGASGRLAELCAGLLRAVDLDLHKAEIKNWVPRVPRSADTADLVCRILPQAVKAGVDLSLFARQVLAPEQHDVQGVAAAAGAADSLFFTDAGVDFEPLATDLREGSEDEVEETEVSEDGQGADLSQPESEKEEAKPKNGSKRKAGKGKTARGAKRKKQAQPDATSE
mmetsp:Transcript_8078/g.17490  ORF Transcript_8078/g.17490 Transcript_8078/m.17490 type:complete len:413 (-) Transcript_8078:19-1257(-)